jgi:hypothetical protein
MLSKINRQLREANRSSFAESDAGGVKPRKNARKLNLFAENPCTSHEYSDIFKGAMRISMPQLSASFVKYRLPSTRWHKSAKLPQLLCSPRINDTIINHPKFLDLSPPKNWPYLTLP